MYRSVTSGVSASLAAVLLSFVVFCHASCQIDMTQTQKSSWNAETTYSLYDVVLTNTGTSEVTNLTLNAPSISNFFHYWEMSLVAPAVLGMPTWRTGSVHPIKVGSSHTFGYIIKSASPASFSVASISCAVGDAGSSTPAPATPGPVTQAPTSTPGATAPPTSSPTSTPKATTAPTSTPTSTPNATTAPTAPTSTSTPKATTAPTSTPKATTAPTSTPTPTPTSTPKATSAPTSTPKATTSPTSAPGGRVCPAGSWWRPSPGTTWQWQLTGTIDQSLNVQMYDIDLFDATASLISSLHSKGRVVICYFSTQYENWRPDASKFTSAILGNALDDWPGEKYVDIRSPVLRQIMSERLDLALSKGCDGVEPDNVDGYSNSNGFSLTANDQLDFNKFIASEAHKKGLSVGLKNDLSQVKGLVTYFDWALNEQCNQYSECSSLQPFVTAGKAVFGVEYSGSASSVCSAMNTAKYSWLMKKLALDASGTQCCASSSAGCVAAPYTCVTSSSAVVDEGSVDDTTKPEEAAVNSASPVGAISFLFASVLCGLLLAL